MKKLLIVLLLFSPWGLIAQENPEDILQPFFNAFQEDPDNAIDYIFSTNPYIDQNQQGIERLKERFNTSRKLLGNYYGEEIMKIQTAGDSFIRYIYMLKYDRQPVKLEILLYKPNDTWLLYTMQFRDNIYEDFEDVAIESF
jgi:hypothetical protein